MTKEIKRLRAEALRRFEGYNTPFKTIALFLHHAQFAERLTGPIKSRIKFIVDHKSKTEIPTRLRWIQPYRGHPDMRKADAAWGKLWAAQEKAWEAREKALAAQSKAGALRLGRKTEVAWEKADMALEKALTVWAKQYEPIFMSENPTCPWNGKTLFPAR